VSRSRRDAAPPAKQSTSFIRNTTLVEAIEIATDCRDPRTIDFLNLR
jgi:hypothetical protein